jgi:class 3 adenylate cyclase/tetratricopeptide (TPR) repeat protein
MASCPACHAENPASNKFCGECGARMPAGCPACGHVNPAGQKFCGECGAGLVAAPASRPTPAAAPAPAAPVAEARPALREVAPETYTPKHLAEKILTSRGALEGERKSVTVLFSDVSGFTAMSERLDPEEVHGIMDRAFEVILAAVHQYEGTINQFLGDGVMALFGAPIAHEDHPHRGLSAALAIQKNLEPLADDVRRAHGIDFKMRVGINTGLVVVGAIGKDLRMDYTAVGDTTNLAARLLAIAKPGQIVVSQHTQHLRAGFFTFEDLGEFQVKGKSAPVRAYALTGEHHGRTRLEVSKERGLTALVGREQELGRLREAFRRATGGKGGAVLVQGEPGVGKSRLLYEFTHSLNGTPAIELEATCPSYGASIPYRPVLDLLRRYLNLAVGASENEIRKRAAEQLEFLGLAGEERAILLAHFLGAPASGEFLARLSGTELKTRTLNLVRDVLLRAGESSTALVIVENVHWADASSGELLADLVGHLGIHRLLLVLSGRPAPLSWLPVAAVETISVGGLGHAETERMARLVLGADRVSEPLNDLLVEKGEGNPLYVEEVLRQLQETGGLLVEDGEARLRSADVRVPEAIHDIIAARVDRLAEPVKLILQAAAVVGRRFGVSLLSRVLGTPPESVAQLLTDLHRLDFVFPAATDPELMFSFKHALTQDVVYGTLLERRRRQYHVATGVGLEELYAERPDEVVELLAYHFERGGENEKAVDYEIRAAEKAQRHWAYTEALSHFDSAVKRLAGMPDNEANRLRQIDVIVKQAEIKFALGQHAEQIQALEGIRVLVETVADPARLARWHYWTGFLHSLTGARPEVTIAHCQEAAAIADASGLDELKAYAECCLSEAYLNAGSLRASMESSERALVMFEERGNAWWAARTLWGLSSAAIFAGEWDRSLEYCRRALEHARSVGDTRMKIVALWRTGWTHIQRGDTATGLRWCGEALALSPSPFDTAMTKAAQGHGLVKSGELTAGTAQLAEAVDWFTRSQLRLTRSVFGIWLADAYLRQGKLSESWATAQEILATSQQAGYRHLEGAAHRLLAEILAQQDPPAAADHVKAALEILREVGARNEVAKTLVAQARLERAAGRDAEARAFLGQALALFESLGTLDGILRARATLTALGGRGRRLLIVSRNLGGLYCELARDLTGIEGVEVVLDRRHADEHSLPASDPGADRRTRSDVDAAIREVGYGIVSEDFGS